MISILYITVLLSFVVTVLIHSDMIFLRPPGSSGLGSGPTVQLRPALVAIPTAALGRRRWAAVRNRIMPLIFYTDIFKSMDCRLRIGVCSRQLILCDAFSPRAVG